MTATTKEKTTAATSYDDLPYAHHTFSYISPEHLEAVGAVFGVNPPKASTARVLELGCGSGLTSAAFAARNPKAKAIGVDTSKVQIEHGQKYVDSLKLKNVELKAISIMDIDKSFGEFDYIICHGVFSWVPAEVQKKILEVIHNHLAPTGIAHVSYNALPGWNIAGTFRDMMQYHADMFVEQKDKIAQAGAFVQFIDGALAESNTPYSKFLRQEAQIVASSGPSYLKHEYLDKGNSQFYFSDFANAAAQFGLSYLGDTSLATMYLGNLPTKAFEQLKVIENIVASEQYMDFITNRRFRNTLLCKNGAQINRNITADIFNKLLTAMPIIPGVPMDKVSFEDNKEAVSFTIDGNGTNFSTTDGILKAAFYTYAEHRGRFLSLDELSTAVVKLCPKAKIDDVKTALKAHFLQLLFKALLEIRATPVDSVDKLSSKPKASEISRYEIASGELQTTNEVSNSISLNLVQKLVLFYADGENTISQIADKVMEHVKKGELTLQSNDKPVADAKQQREFLESIVQQTLEVMKNWYFIVG